jgi:lipopolysaccharide/colanic/teichoic acid biosynthesis glycosyltransferase
MSSDELVLGIVETGVPSTIEVPPVSGRRARFLSAKRVVDFVVALTLLVILSPVVVVLAAAVVTTSRGPAFVSQWRVGRRGRLFRIHAFRTEFVDDDRDALPAWARDESPQVTPVGRVLRATGLERLPALVDVLRGDMSFVGPRAERPAFSLASTASFCDARLSVRPGLVGLERVRGVRGGGAKAARRRLACDVVYMRRMGWRTDAGIVLAAIARAAVRDGVAEDGQAVG